MSLQKRHLKNQNQTMTGMPIKELPRPEMPSGLDKVVNMHVILSTITIRPMSSYDSEPSQLK